MKLTAERLRELFSYDPQTGIFIRRRFDKKGRQAARPKPTGWVDLKGYIRIEINGRGYGAHALAWLYVYGEWPRDQLDHINGAKADNRIRNLRECDTAQNCAGRALRQDNATGFKGVSKVGDRWRARIRVTYQGIDLGRYASAEAAARAYDDAARRYYGPFARTNRMLGLLP